MRMRVSAYHFANRSSHAMEIMRYSNCILSRLADIAATRNEFRYRRSYYEILGAIYVLLNFQMQDESRRGRTRIIRSIVGRIAPARCRYCARHMARSLIPDVEQDDNPPNGQRLRQAATKSPVRSRTLTTFGDVCICHLSPRLSI